MTRHAIETHGLSRTFGRLDAVRGLDLKVPAGSVFALIGPNAAGKTTTIKMLKWLQGAELVIVKTIDAGTVVRRLELTGLTVNP